MSNQTKKKQLQETYAGVRMALAKAVQDEEGRARLDRKNARIEALAAELTNGYRSQKGKEEPVELTVTETIQRVVRLLQLAGAVAPDITEKIAARGFGLGHATDWIVKVAEIEDVYAKHLLTALGIELYATTGEDE